MERVVVKKARDLQVGDRFRSTDGRGIEKVTANRPYVAGRRSIRTTRCDHHWANDRPVEVIDPTT